MSDPAVEAAKRAWAAAPDLEFDQYREGEDGLWTPAAMEAAAREALAPLRVIVDELRTWKSSMSRDTGEVFPFSLIEDMRDELAALVYPTEEL